jgi:Flp pilus assembly protein TadD
MTRSTRYKIASVVLSCWVLGTVGCSQPDTPGTVNPTSSVTSTPNSPESKPDESQEHAQNAESAPPGSTISDQAKGENTVSDGTTAVKPSMLQVDPERAQQLVQQAHSEKTSGNFAAAETLYEQALMANPSDGSIPFGSSCNYAAWGKTDLAIETLTLAAQLGYSDSAAVESKAEFESLRGNPRFSKAEEMIRANR